ncbi:CTP synthase [Patescibacteria group bacterium]|nr:CTP synthase [Patescibacteria group bacterium]
MKSIKTRYIFVTGGVISSLGKGITSASLGMLLKSKGYSVVNMKSEMYVNIDAGTIRPTEHGEVFVTNDGIETDQDIGTYERFLNKSLTRAQFITTGQIYQEVIKRERNFEYEGEDVEVVPHVPEEIIRRVKEAGKQAKAEIVIIELGGTVGEYQGVLFLEAARMMEQALGRDHVIHVHVSYLPIPKSVGEMKTKPVQYSVRTLNSHGIVPHFIVGRSERELDKKRKEKIKQFCGVEFDHVISNPDCDSIYLVPEVLEKQKFAEIVLKDMGLKPRKTGIKKWESMVNDIMTTSDEVNIAIVGKYFKTGDYALEDSYVSVIEAIKHGAWGNNVKANIHWVNSEKFEKDAKTLNTLLEMDGVIVPGGYGKRGLEGKIKAVRFVREHDIPYFGLCLGLQMAVIEFARHVCGLKTANTVEAQPNTKYPVIEPMEEQKKLLEKKQYGGTNRLGAYECAVKKNTISSKAYGKNMVSERHRHRYEVSNDYRDILSKHGLVFAGVNPKLDLVEIIENPSHPWFVGTQFHPEFQSRPLAPHPLFKSFIKACKERRKKI